ncbi:hypothetical protein ACIHCQ_41690 [Streptomyces sp. NPDC052236]|uniref:hypothetical protein n=1 Tax=Streptomyces sp. NPDC052236 TaxID=3365686 RepID=UPI0037D0720A
MTDSAHVGNVLAAGASIGVLLPLRLETRFFPPAGNAGWMLKVRIVPDAAFLDRHYAVPTAAELDAVEALWQLTANDLTTPDGIAQWRRFAAQVGAARGAWLARTFPARPAPAGGWTINRPAQVREGLDSSRVAGLPPTLELWLGRGGAAPSLLASLTVDHTRLGLDPPDPTTGETRWWTSFARAKEVGLGAEVDLGPDRPDDIDVLYVTGLGDADPAELFTSHRDAGNLGVLALGTPTNSVDGEPAADLARDPETWRVLLTTPPPQPAAEALGLALTGRPSALAPLPGADIYHVPLNQALVAGLWSALWGHAVKDVWGLGDRGLAAGLWALDNLVPEGPLPPLRIGDQPYGVLPVSSSERWVPEASDPAVEAGILPVVAGLTDAAARAAEAAGTVVGAETERLLDLIGRVPMSRGYAWRWALPLELVHLLEWAFGDGATFPALRSWWDATAAPVLALAGPPRRRYATIGEPQDLRLPLVVPGNLPEGTTLDDMLERLLMAPPQQLASAGQISEIFRRRIPTSLLFRLLLHARLVDAAEVVRAANRQTGPLLEPIQTPAADPTELAGWGARFAPSLLTHDAAGTLFGAGRAGVAALIGADPAALERAFCATLDTASHRVDAWLTGIAWRRLRDLTARTPQPVFRLGAYGWLDAPRPRTAAARPAEFLHAPSQEQALTAAVLRDRALSDAEPGRWQMTLDSDSVRLAAQLADEVRLGAHISEVLGRAVERAVGARSAVESLRRQFPVRKEHAGRRVCDGQAVLARYVANPAGLGLNAGQLEALAPLATAVDVYGDLLVANAVFDVVSGRGGMAAASMDAAAGLAAPPSLDVLRTQRAGRSARSTVAVALPADAPPAVVDAHTSPGALAEPAVAALLTAETGDPAGAAWTWQVVDEQAAVLGTVTLAQLGLQPVDTLSLSGADLHRLVLAALPGAAVVPEGDLPAQLAARRLSDILGGRPVVPADLSTVGTAPPAAAVQSELAARYAAVHALALDVHASLAAAPGAGPAALRQALVDAARWGITPLSADGAGDAVLVTRAGIALAERLERSPSVAEATDLAPAGLARALAELVSPEGRLPVLSRLPLDTFPTPLSAEPSAAGTALDPDWLEVVSAVRPHVARLEVHQLGRRIAGGAPFSAWSNRPGDPWQLDPSLDPIGPQPHGLVQETNLLAVFGPTGTLEPGADPQRSVAFGLLDSWSEVIPSGEHVTTAAFRIDAPGARAPQAVLIAVPPDVSVPLDTSGLIDILGEARRLARARAAGPDELDAFAAGEPLTLLPVNQPTGVRLEPR